MKLLNLKRFAAISLVVLLCMAALPTLVPQASAAGLTFSMVTPRYDISAQKTLDLDTANPEIRDRDLIGPEPWTYSVGTDASIDFTDNGAVVSYTSNLNVVQIRQSDGRRLASDTVRIVTDVAIPTSGYMNHRAIFHDQSTAGKCYEVSISIESTITRIHVNNWIHGATHTSSVVMATDNLVSAVDGKIPLDILISIQGSNIRFGQNGAEILVPINGTLIENTYFNYISLRPVGFSPEDISSAGATYHRLEISNKADVQYQDNLRISYTPWGYDMTMAMHLHADFTRPEMVDLLTELSTKYGLRGTLDTFIVGSSYYGEGLSENAILLQSVLDAKSSGWEIGTHALDARTIDRETAISHWNQYLSLIGEYPRVWSDHGAVMQGLLQGGADPLSDHYIADLLQAADIIAWPNNVSQYHAISMDLTVPGIHEDTIAGIDTFKTSYQSLLLRTAEVNYPQYYSGYLSNRAVIVTHDYSWRVAVVKSDDAWIGALYATADLHGMVVTADVNYHRDPLNTYPNNEWQIHPRLTTMLDQLSDANIWSAGVSEIYRYNQGVSALSVEESDRFVIITNPSDMLRGLTLYTMSTERPEYSLYYNGKYYHAHQGATGWHFVIDEVPSGQSMKLTKVEIPSEAPMPYLDSIGVAVWNTDGIVYLRALDDGEVRLDPGFEGPYHIQDLTANVTVDYESSSVAFAVAEGSIYSIQALGTNRPEQIDTAMPPLYAVIPVIVGIVVIGAVIMMVGRLKD